MATSGAGVDVDAPLGVTGSFKLSSPDFAWPLMDHLHVLDHIVALGIDAVDVGVLPGRSHVTPETVLKGNLAHAITLRREIEDRGLRIADFFFAPEGLSPESAINQPDPRLAMRSMENFQRGVEFAKALGAPGMTINSGIHLEDETVEQSIRRSSEALKSRVDIAAQNGLALSIEGAVGTNSDTPEKVAELLNRVPGLSLTLDYSHFVFADIPGLLIDDFIGDARHFHFRGAGSGRMQTDFATNEVDYSRIVRMIQASSYTGYICIEYVWTSVWDCNRTENTMETILFRDFLRGFQLA